MHTNLDELHAALTHMQRYVAHADAQARLDIEQRLQRMSRHAIDSVAHLRDATLHLEPVRCAMAVNNALNASNHGKRPAVPPVISQAR